MLFSMSWKHLLFLSIHTVHQTAAGAVFPFDCLIDLLIGKTWEHFNPNFSSLEFIVFLLNHKSVMEFKVDEPKAEWLGSNYIIRRWLHQLFYRVRDDWSAGHQRPSQIALLQFFTNFFWHIFRNGML